MAAGPVSPTDPAALDPAVETLAAGTRLFRVHPDFLDADAFNPRFGAGGRFHFIATPAGAKVPSLYAAEGRPAAIAETLFHDVPLRPRSFRAISASKLEGKALSQLRTRRPIQLVVLHHPGLGRLGLAPQEITATDPSAYPYCRQWAQALHDRADDEGLVWMSRLYNTARAFTFFGDRVASTDFEPLGDPLPLASGAGLNLVYELAEESGITILQA